MITIAVITKIRGIEIPTIIAVIMDGPTLVREPKMIEMAKNIN